MPTILIVDDRFSSRQTLAELAHTFHQETTVEAFSNPEDALRWLNWHAADLVLTRYDLPQITGVEFIRRVRELPGGSHLPLVIITAADDRYARYAALDAGATDSLTDPVDHVEWQVRCRNLLTQYQQHRIIQDRAHWLEKQVSEAVSAIRVREQETLLRLAKAGEYRDEETGNHVVRMAKYARLIAEAMGLEREEAEIIELAAPMHDIGKIGIPDDILLKPDRLPPEEFEIMKRHTVIGYEILKDSPSQYLQMGAVIALGHHEKFNGTGYPHGLRGEDIPLSARIVAVADVYDALTSARPYKRAWEADEAFEFMQRNSGTHFDPRCLDAFHSQMERVIRIQKLLSDHPEPALPERHSDIA
ncbi:HD domain-containing protein [Thiohalobacter sp. IOR34]|uniref:HD domain-containing phosphohydrolase n=1 Tax=Thiohalobacter sp. IOR34 TaxID=3057176 RepID=UPI0025B0898C|nr:HD domain-containing phosphohydrolase [Thiohalobacter sp. IOR34]WJW74984.1 HD domain-containing protein [Thiohalobacter sp. IOR34]